MNCIQCAHYFITWDYKFPMGCKLFEIKSQSAPHIKILEITGQECQGFQKKPTNDSQKKRQALSN